MKIDKIKRIKNAIKMYKVLSRDKDVNPVLMQGACLRGIERIVKDE